MANGRSKKITRIYWTFTGLMAVFIIVFSIPDVIRHPEAIAIMEHLGYPTYLLPFLGVMKILGITAILVPAFHKAKEWAYAGLVFDLLGAFFSSLSVGDPPGSWIIPLLALAMVLISYQAGIKRQMLARIPKPQLLKKSNK